MRCTMCGRGELVDKNGTFVFGCQAGPEVRSSHFYDAKWLVCETCGAEILPGALIARIFTLLQSWEPE